MIKKVLLYTSGPGAIILIGIALFIHLFSDYDGKIWIKIGLAIFFFIFLPFYAVENFRQNDRQMKDKNSNIQFSDKNKRIDWEGGNIHGKVPKINKRKGFLNRKGR